MLKILYRILYRTYRISWCYLGHIYKHSSRHFGDVLQKVLSPILPLLFL